jgi:hypothetical protein
MQGDTLSDQADNRLLLGSVDFSTKGAYRLLHQDLQDPLTQYIWDSCVPNKVKVFGRLMRLNRLNTLAKPQTQKHHRLHFLPKVPSVGQRFATLVFSYFFSCSLFFLIFFYGVTIQQLVVS